MKIVYDGECPFCSRYVAMIRLRETVRNVEMVSARSDHPAVSKVKNAGYDLNQGMALVDGDTVYFGADCIHRLALMSTSSGPFNRLNALIFSSPRVSRVLYPILRAGRNTTLRLLGRRPI